MGKKTRAAGLGLVSGGQADDAEGGALIEPRTLAVSRRGVRTGEDFANFMSALMSDVIEGALNPGVANAAVNAGGKLLKVVEMQHRYGRKPGGEAGAPLVLSTGETGIRTSVLTVGEDQPA